MKKMQFFFNENMLGKLSGFSHMHKRKKKIRVFEIMIFFLFLLEISKKIRYFVPGSYLTV
jgi:hypothetical protein